MKNKACHYIFYGLSVFILYGCLQGISPHQAPVAPVSRLAPEEFAAKIEELNKKKIAQSKQHLNSEKTSEIHLELARLYLSSKNPERNIQNAALELHHYLETNSTGKKRVDAENTLAILDEIDLQKNQIDELQETMRTMRTALDKGRKAGPEIQKLSQENAALKKQQKKLLADNERLNKTLEKLKFLDLSLEKKRKAFR